MTMQTSPSAAGSLPRRFFSREGWIGPVWGFFCSVAVSLIGRAFDLEYRREAANAVYFLVFVLVSAHYSGELNKYPRNIVGWALAAALMGVAIVRWTL